MTPRIEVRCGSRVFAGWKSLTVDTSLEEAVSAVSMEIAGPVAATDDMILDGDAITVYHGDQLVFTGYCDDVQVREDAQGSSVTLAGRSRTCDAVDCSAPSKVWRSVRLGDLAAELLGEYGIDLSDEANVASRVIPKAVCQPSESVFDMLDRITREMRILIADDAQGRLVFTRAGASGDASDGLVLPGNVMSMSGRQSGRDRFSTIEVKGQVATGEIDFATSGTYEDRRVKRHRRLIVVPEKGITSAEAAWRANWEALTRAGRSVQYHYGVQGWVQSDGALWRRNTDVVITDPARRFVQTPMLITAVQYSLSENGTTSTVTVAPVSAYTPEPVKEPRSGAGGRSSGRWSKWDAGGVE